MYQSKISNSRFKRMKKNLIKNTLLFKEILLDLYKNCTDHKSQVQYLIKTPI